MTTSWIIIAVLGIIAAYLIVTYNRLVRGRNRVREAWADIDVQLKRRHNLIPNLVEAVKGYMTHERGVLENVTKARSAVMGAKNPADVAEKESMLSDALKSLFAVSEAYPALRASENFAKLQDELSDTETKISASNQSSTHPFHSICCRHTLMYKNVSISERKGII